MWARADEQNKDLPRYAEIKRCAAQDLKGVCRVIFALRYCFRAEEGDVADFRSPS